MIPPACGIIDLARAICPGCEIKYIGIRPGKKIHEVLISRDEARNTLDVEMNIPVTYYQRHGIGLAFLFGSAVEEFRLPPGDLKVAGLFLNYDFQCYLRAWEERIIIYRSSRP